MRRALAILKYVPAVLCGLLVVAWVVSLLYQLEVRVWRVNCVLMGSNLILSIWQRPFADVYCNVAETEFRYPPPLTLSVWFGYLHWWEDTKTTQTAGITVPIPFIVTLLVPVACTPLFRFPLWSYFAWMALIAAELAYYLR